MTDLTPDPHDSHVQTATRIFRDVGFTLAAMQYPRPPEALAGLRRFHRVPADWVEPVGWRYFPNAWCRDNWKAMTP